MIIIPMIVRRIITFGLIVFYTIKYTIALTLYYIYTMLQKRKKQRLNPPKSLTDSQYGSHVYLPVKGVKIHYMEMGDKSKPLLLFIHGFPEFWYSWRHQLTEFSKDYWCIALDLRGYGYSDKPEGLGNYTVDKIVEEVKDLVQLLGKDRFTIVGHDWGSLITGAFVDRFGDMLEKYILMSAPSVDVHYTLLMSDYQQFRKSWYIFLFSAPYVPELMLGMNDYEMFDKSMGRQLSKYITADDIEAYKYTFSKPGALTPPLNYYRNAVMFPPQTQIQKPNREDVEGLLILGEKDPYISEGCVPLMKDKYKRLQVEILKGAYHFIQQENPVEVNQLIRKFLSKK